MSSTALAAAFYERLALYSEEGPDPADFSLAAGLLLGSGFPSCAASVAALCAVSDLRPAAEYCRELIDEAKRIKAEALK